MLNDDDLVESIERHFLAGCGFLDAAQLEHHRKGGVCPECAARTLLAAGVRVKVGTHE